ncbi:hypothetical protein RFI_38501, partial [Reticulomyxa filosa]
MDYNALLWVFFSCFLVSLLAAVIFWSLATTSATQADDTGSDQPQQDGSKKTKKQEENLNVSKGAHREEKYGLRDLEKVQESKPLELPPKLVLVTDLGHTLIGCGRNEPFQRALSNLQNSVLVYAMEEPINRYEMITKDYTQLLKPDVLICKDGLYVYWLNPQLATLVQEQSSTSRQFELEFDQEEMGMKEEEFAWLDRDWEAELRKSWDQRFAESLYFEWNKQYQHTSTPSSKTTSLCLQPFRVTIFTNSMEQAIDAKQFLTTR